MKISIPQKMDKFLTISGNMRFLKRLCSMEKVG
jgi:hypothetical protein